MVIASVTPRQVLKETFAAKVIQQGAVWIALLDHRNLLSHTYDFALFEAAVTQIAGNYLPAMSDLYRYFTERSQR